jgi:hypothetical protein
VGVDVSCSWIVVGDNYMRALPSKTIRKGLWHRGVASIPPFSFASSLLLASFSCPVFRILRMHSYVMVSFTYRQISRSSQKVLYG